MNVDGGNDIPAGEFEYFWEVNQPRDPDQNQLVVTPTGNGGEDGQIVSDGTEQPIGASAKETRLAKV